MLFLAYAFAVAVLVSPYRRWLRTPGPYAGAAIAIVLFLPHVIWQMQLGWPTLEFMANAQENKNFFTIGSFLSAQVLQQNPLLLPLWLGGLLALIFLPALR